MKKPIQVIREFVGENFYIEDLVRIDDHTSLLEQGIVDSTGLLEIIAFVETEFGVEVADDEVAPENFDSIHRIAEFVARRRA